MAYGLHRVHLPFLERSNVDEITDPKLKKKYADAFDQWHASRNSEYAKETIESKFNMTPEEFAKVKPGKKARASGTSKNCTIQAVKDMVLPLAEE